MTNGRVLEYTLPRLPYLSIIAGENIDNIRSMMQMIENLKDYDSNFLKVAMLRGSMEKLGLNNTY